MNENIDSLLKRVCSSIHHEEPNYLLIDSKFFLVIYTLYAKEGLKSKKKFNYC